MVMRLSGKTENPNATTVRRMQVVGAANHVNFTIVTTVQKPSSHTNPVQMVINQSGMVVGQKNCNAINAKRQP